MMRSLYSGVSGLRNHQTRMDVIGNNIANVNTAGFKTSRVIFQDIYSQTAKSASTAIPAGGPYTQGGTNPLQIGLGVTIAAIDVLHTSSAAQRTDNPTDLMIQGDGFFTVTAPDGMKYYTRAGNLYVDNVGNLVTASGYLLQGVVGVPGADPSDWVDAIEPTDGKIPAADLDAINVAGFKGISIDDKGVVRGLDENGDTKVLAYIAVATFTNTGGLEKKGTSLYAQSTNSGAPEYCQSGQNGAGDVIPGSLEMSNVDLASEFTDMIITQRGFQANSRVITTSDTMLEELINLKR